MTTQRRSGWARRPRQWAATVVLAVLLLPVVLSSAGASAAGAAPGRGSPDLALAAPASSLDPAASPRPGEVVPDFSFVPTTATPAQIVQVEALARATVADLVDDWTRRLGHPTSVRLWTVQPEAPRLYSACSDSVVNDPLTAFYCPADDTIWIHDLLLLGFEQRFGAFAVASVLAHEFGHNLRAETGIVADGTRPVALLELDADCLAGSWAADQNAARPLTAPQVTGAANAFRAVGDTLAALDRHHGTPQERMAAWFQGLDGWTCPLGPLGATAPSA